MKATTRRPLGCRTALTLLVALLAGCTSAPPKQVEDLCEIFYEKGGWYDDAKDSERRWGIPIPVMMAMTYQESSYKANARPPRRKILWIIPWTRPASAYGYAQATDEAWRDYTRSTGRGFTADRDDFEDAIDFVGWYNRRSADALGLRRDDAYSLYLAYHDGVGGFRRGTWRSKDWLKDAARRVATRAQAYQADLARCEDDLDGPWWWPF